MAYVTTSDFIEYANIYASDYSSDGTAEGRWTNLIGRSTAIIEAVTGRSFEATATTGTTDVPVSRYYDAVEDVDGYILYFDRDICNIGTITNGNAVTISDTEYVTLPRNNAPYYAVKILNSANKDWTYTNDPEGAITVAGVWAYSIVPPNDIKHACLRLTKWLEDQRKSNADLDRPLLTGDGAVVMPNKIPADVTSILAKYKRIEIR